MDKLTELRQALGKAVDELGTDEFIRSAEKYDAKSTEIADLQAQIDRLDQAQKRAASLARPVAGSSATGSDELSRAVSIPTGFSMDSICAPAVRAAWSGEDYVRNIRKAINFEPVKGQHFQSFGEQLRAVANWYMPEHRSYDERLIRAPQGMSETDPSSGGFLVQTDFATAIFARAYDIGIALNAAQKLAISTSANGIKIPAVDETSRANGSRWGGVSSTWIGEGTSGASSKPKMRLIELDLKKLIASFYMTDELMADTSVLTKLAMQAFSEEIMFKTEAAMFAGTGGGMPQGFMTSNAKVTVAKEKGQPAGTVLYENVKNMWSRLWARSRPNAAWYINQDVEPQLLGMSQVIGTGGVPVYLPANGISGQTYGTLFGRPVVPMEYCETVGTEGDIVLADMSQYVLADKGGVQMASSMHVAFLTDEMVFRLTYRVDGKPIWHAPLTPFKGSNTLSPFITLQTR